MFRIKVESYSGHKAEERPVAITIGEERFEVQEILDRWLGEDHEYFKLKASDNRIYIIRYDRPKNQWELVKLEKVT